MGPNSRGTSIFRLRESNSGHTLAIAFVAFGCALSCRLSKKKKEKKITEKWPDGSHVAREGCRSKRFYWPLLSP